MAAAKIAIITGAGSGIGRTVAFALASKGYALALAGRRSDALQQTAAHCQGASDVLCCPCDVTKEEQVRGLFSATLDRFGRVDLLFNNAGVSTPAQSIEDVSLADWSHVIHVNLTGAFLCLREAFRIMKEQTPRGGRIINNGSIASVTPRPNSSAYCASKHAITGLTKSASLDGRKYDIACGQIDIGNATTEMGSTVEAGTLQANGEYAVEPVFDVSLVGDAVVYMDSLPPEANVQFLTLIATKMPFIGRG